VEEYVLWAPSVLVSTVVQLGMCPTVTAVCLRERERERRRSCVCVHSLFAALSPARTSVSINVHSALVSTHATLCASCLCMLIGCACSCSLSLVLVQHNAIMFTVDKELADKTRAEAESRSSNVLKKQQRGMQEREECVMCSG
jgi:hypothetical protein